MGCTLCDSLYSQVCGDQIAELVQGMKMNGARVARVFFFSETAKSNFIKLLCTEAGHRRPKRDVNF